MNASPRTLRRLVAVVAVAAVLSSCASDSDPAGAPSTTRASTEQSSTTSTSVPDAAPADVVPGVDWTVTDPEDQGMDAATLETARDYAFADGRNTQGVVVVRGGEIVAEWYAPGEDQDSWAASWSVAKSVVSALIGIAIDEGDIPSIDEPMTTYYPEWKADERAEITLRDVLEMSAGLKWNEDYAPDDLDASDVVRMVLKERDQLAYAASRPVESPPGTVFNYSSGASMLLSGVLEQATGTKPADYAAEKLWDPIQVDKVDMWSDAEGHTLTYCCVDTTSRDFARFGLLYLNEGRWGTEQVVPESWVADSLEGSRAAPDTYGLQWWLEDVEGVPGDLFQALGHDDQYIYAIPSLDLVVVRNGSYTKYDGEPVADPNLFARYPSGDIVPGQGTAPAVDGWDSAEFLAPILASIEEGA
jgi:CubicO group peptidase (beta-lactamase class C family)